MANEEHLARLREGVEAWNAWREEDPSIRPDLSEVTFYRKNLSGVNFCSANLRGANLREAYLFDANLNKADLSDTILSEANLCMAQLTEANLSRTDLSRANLQAADLSRADLSEADLGMAYLFQTCLRGACLDEANLEGANFVCTNIEDARIRGCHVHGASVWGLEGQPAEQRDLVITPWWEPEITVDNLKVAQFIYLLLNNPDIRDVIDTITSKVVLILGRFTDERKPVLDALRDELRKRNRTPLLFDFAPSQNRDTVETVRTLAGMAQFIIADITDAKSIVGELKDIVPSFPSVPVQPIIRVGDIEYGMFDHIKRFAWVLEPYQYTDTASLLAALGRSIVEPAQNKWKELTGHA